MPYTNDSKPSGSWSNDTRSSSSWTGGVDYLLKEDSFYLLLESGFKIILNQSTGGKEVNSYTNDSK